jgi:hypothetical protein
MWPAEGRVSLLSNCFPAALRRVCASVHSSARSAVTDPQLALLARDTSVRFAVRALQQRKEGARPPKRPREDEASDSQSSPRSSEVPGSPKPSQMSTESSLSPAREGAKEALGALEAFVHLSIAETLPFATVVAIEIVSDGASYVKLGERQGESHCCFPAGRRQCLVVQL